MFAFRYDGKLGWWPMNKPAKSETAMTEGDAMRQLTTIAALVVALVTPAAARSLVVLDRPTLACSDQQALETALTLARLHDGPAFRDHAGSYGCMWIEPDDGPLAVVANVTP